MMCCILTLYEIYVKSTVCTVIHNNNYYVNNRVVVSYDIVIV